MKLQILSHVLVAAFVMFLSGFSVVCKINEVNALIEARNYKHGLLRCEQLIDHAYRIMPRKQQWRFHSIVDKAAAVKERE